MNNIVSNIIVYDRATGIAKLQFPYVQTIEIVTDRNEFTDTCTIGLPQKISDSGNKISDLISIGDKIIVEYGYYPNIETEFTGYITEISTRFNMVIKCEDEAYNYKIKNIGESFTLKDTTYRELLARLYTGEIRTTDDKIGTWQVTGEATLLDVLDELKSTLGTVSYWQNSILYVGYEFNKSAGKTIKALITENVPIDGNNIRISPSSDVGVVSYGLSPQKDGSKVFVYSYYKDSATKEIISTTTRPNGTLNKFEVPGLAYDDLRKLTERRLPKLYSEYATGEITVLAPTVNHGDNVLIIDNQNTDISATYEITGITKTLSMSNGIKQTLKIGQKILSL